MFSKQMEEQILYIMREIIILVMRSKWFFWMGKLWTILDCTGENFNNTYGWQLCLHITSEEKSSIVNPFLLKEVFTHVAVKKERSLTLHSPHLRLSIKILMLSSKDQTNNDLKRQHYT